MNTLQAISNRLIMSPYQAVCQPLIQQLSIAPLASVAALPFADFKVDSRQVEPNDVFVLLKSQTPNESVDYTKVIGYLAQVQEHAVFVLSEIDLNPNNLSDEIADQLQHLKTPIIYLPMIRDYLGSLIYYSLPMSEALLLPAVVAVTGTNGKTTVSQLIAQLMNLAGQKTAVMGTAGNGILPHLTPATHTTLEVFHMQHHLHDIAQAGVQVLSLEASSHGLYQQRLQGVPVRVAVYTNLSRDHLDYHHDMDEYAQAKSRLFNKTYFPTLTHAIINQDDAYADLMQQTALASGLTVWRYSLTDPSADFFVKTMSPSLSGVHLTIQTPSEQITFDSPLLGQFNVANLLASTAAAMALGLTVEQIMQGVPQLQGASGRMERIASTKGCFIVDYAHTPDALIQVLTSLKSHCQGKLWAVFGCGGDRDKGKRPLMAQAALAVADRVVLTADNPRSEDPRMILQDMQAGMSASQLANIQIEPDRRQAINEAVKAAGTDDIVVIAGKGHETYQEIKGVRYDFDDRKQVAAAIQQFNK